MMKRFYLTCVFLVVAVCQMIAGPVSAEQALRTAREAAVKSMKKSSGKANAMQQPLKLAQKRTAATLIEGMTDYPLYYVFNRGEGQGYIIVAGEDRLQPILGMAEEGKFDASTTNENFKWWLDAMAYSVEQIARQPDARPAKVAPGKESAENSYLMSTQWAQNKPFNSRCPSPKAGADRCVTGCVATALAQICNYHRYPVKGIGEVAYTTRTYGIDIHEDLGAFEFDYNNMLDSYAGQYNSTQENAVATLMYACGIVNGMNYHPTASGSILNIDAIIKHLGFDKGARGYNRYDYDTYGWTELMNREIDNKRPVFYSAYNAHEGGHAFVIDGYNSQGLYHVNWGWGGNNNGFYDISLLNPYAPADGGFNYQQAMVVGLQPEGGNMAATVREKLRFDGLELEDEKASVAFNKGDMVKVLFSNIIPLFTDFDGYVGLGVYDKSGNLLRDYSTITALELTANQQGTLTLPWYTSRKMTDGRYTVRPIISPDGETIYVMTTAKGKGTAATLSMEVKGNEVTLGCYPAETLKLYPSERPSYTNGLDGATAGKVQSFYVTVVNNGDYYQGEVAVSLNGKQIGSNYVFLEPGETADIFCNGTMPAETGEYPMEVTADNAGSIGTCTLNVVSDEGLQAHLECKEIKAVKPVVNYGESLIVALTVACTDAYYDGGIYCSVHDVTNGYYIDWYKQNFYVNQDEEKTFTYTYLPTQLLDASCSKEARLKVEMGYVREGYIHELGTVYVDVVDPSAGITTVKTAGTKRKGIYNLQGMKMTKDLHELPKGIYIKDGILTYN